MPIDTNRSATPLTCPCSGITPCSRIWFAAAPRTAGAARERAAVRGGSPWSPAPLTCPCPGHCAAPSAHTRLGSARGPEAQPRHPPHQPGPPPQPPGPDRGRLRGRARLPPDWGAAREGTFSSFSRSPALRFMAPPQPPARPTSRPPAPPPADYSSQRPPRCSPGRTAPRGSAPPAELQLPAGNAERGAVAAGRAAARVATAAVANGGRRGGGGRAGAVSTGRGGAEGLRSPGAARGCLSVCPFVCP